MTPLEYYLDQVKEGHISKDPEQLKALDYLQRAYHELIEEASNRASWKRLFQSQKNIKGVYLWGGVGIGKTLLMDAFFLSLPFKQKKRMHFYQFMERIHHELKKYQGQKDPLQIIASDLAKEAMVICFDELFVSDITDAMLLGRLFKALFSRHVTLVATSNTPPDDLYKNGLQREQFLPAIEALKLNMDIIHLPTSIDYRLRHLKEAGVFYTPLDNLAKEKMEKSFEALSGNDAVETSPILVHDRPIEIKKRTDKVVWFDFDAICSVPRSQQDFLAIAKQYHTVLISDIPVIPPESKDKICLFISLVDVFYDARVRLVISAAEPVAEIYSRGYMILEYTRTHSRLLEMQSLDYFASEESSLLSHQYLSE